jgi:hypothetical protein
MMPDSDIRIARDLDTESSFESKENRFLVTYRSVKRLWLSCHLIMCYETTSQGLSS